MTAKWQYKEAYEAALVTARDLKAENKKLKAENDKMRDLVKLMHGTIKDLQIAFDVSVIVGGVELSAEYYEAEYMRELGIEVE